MNQQAHSMLHPRSLTLLAIIFAVVLFRFLPHPPNVSPVAAISLFAGAYFVDRKLAFVVPFAAMLLSDMVLGFHSTMVYVYAALGLTVVMGFWLQRRRSITNVTLAAIGSSLLFFVITNFGVWFSGLHGYAMNTQGLMQTYIAGIPFLQNSVLGNLAFVALLFGGFGWLQKVNRKLQVSPSH